MERKAYDHAKLEGIDADLETSLKEYGMAWIETKDEFLFYYGLYADTENPDEYKKFDFRSFSKKLNFKEEFNWVDWDRIQKYLGQDIMDLPFPERIFDLYSYYGPFNVFGDSSYWEGLDYDEIITPNHDTITIDQAVDEIVEQVQEITDDNYIFELYKKVCWNKSKLVDGKIIVLS